jgi:hypothetical protein
MFRTKTSIAILSVTAIVTVCTCGIPIVSADQAYAPYTLAYKYATGHVRKYNVTVDSTNAITTAGHTKTTDTHIEEISTSKVTAIRNTDGAAIEEVTGKTSVATENGSPMSMQGLPQDHDTPMTVVMSKTGRMLSVIPIPGDLPRPGYADPTAFVTVAFLPTTPVNEGDTWNSTFPLPALRLTIYCQSTLKSVSYTGGVNIALIDTTVSTTPPAPGPGANPMGQEQGTNSPQQFEPRPQMGYGQPTQSSARLDGDVLAKFDMDAGQVISTIGNLTFSDVSAPAQGSNEMPMVTHSNIRTLTSLAP